MLKIGFTLILNNKYIWKSFYNDFFEFKFLTVLKNSNFLPFLTVLKKLTVLKNPHYYCLELNEHEKRV